MMMDDTEVYEDEKKKDNDNGGAEGNRGIAAEHESEECNAKE